MAGQDHAALLIGVDPETEARLLAAAKGLSVRRTAADPKALAEALAQNPSRWAIVALESGSKAAAGLDLIRHAARGGARVVAFARAKDADLILEAVRAGAQEFLVPGEEQRLARALRQAQAGAEKAQITTLFPAKGGSGATSIATHLAAALARRGERTCLVDLDPTFGGVSSALELKGGWSIAELLSNAHRADEALLDRSLARHPSGAFVVSHGERIEDAERVAAKDVSALLALLSRHYRHVVVDGVRGFDEAALAALDAADRVLLVATQEVPSLRNATRAADLFRRLGYAEDKVRLVVNRFHKNARISAAIAEETAGVPVLATLGNDFAGLSDAVNRGSLLCDTAPRSALWLDVEQLAGQLSHGDGQGPGERGSFLSRLFSRS